METSSIEQQIGSFLAKTFMVELGKNAKPDTDLFDAGFIDSYGFVELIAFLEKTFSVAFTDDDLSSAEMSTLQGISKIVAARQSVAAAS